jgi:hypothetical protein
MYTVNYSEDVTSSTIKHLYYSSETNVLFVQFNSDRIYGYTQVPYAVYSQFVSSPSAGRFYNQVVADTYPSMGMVDPLLIDVVLPSTPSAGLKCLVLREVTLSPEEIEGVLSEKDVISVKVIK